MSTPEHEILNRFENGEILGIAELVCPRERMAAEINDSQLQWDSRQFNHFSVNLALEDVQFEGSLDDDNFLIYEARFHVFGDREGLITVNRDNEAFVREDEWCTDLVREFVEVYADHSHQICINSLRKRREAELQKRQAGRHSEPIGLRPPLTIPVSDIQSVMVAGR